MSDYIDIIWDGFYWQQCIQCESVCEGYACDTDECNHDWHCPECGHVESVKITDINDRLFEHYA